MESVSSKAPSRMSIFLKGEAVSAFWNFSTKGIALVNTILTITSLTLYQYGVFQLLLSFSGIPSDFVNLGSAVVSNEVSRAIAEERLSDAKRIFLEYAVFRLAFALIVWIAVFFGSTYFFSAYNIDFIRDMRIVSFLFLSEGLFMVIRMFCLARLQFGVVALRYTINKCVQAAILIYFYLDGHLGLKQLIWSMVIASAVSVICSIPQFIKTYSKWSHIQMTSQFLITDIFWAYGTWDTLRQFVNKIVFRLKPWLIKIFIGTEAVAIFAIAETMVTALQDILPNNTLQSLVPLWIQDQKLSVKMFSYGIKYFVLMGTILAVIAAIFVPPFVYIFFAKYSASIPLFYFMLLNLPIFAAGILIGNYIIAFRKQRYLLFLHVFRSLLSFTIIITTLHFIGLWGLALDFVLVPIIIVITNYLYTKNQEHGFHFDLKIIFGYTAEDKEIIKNAFSIVRNWSKKVAFWQR